MIITRYITRELSVSLLTVITVLILALLSQQIVRYLNYVAVGKISTSVLVELVSFEVPYLLALLLPLALYLGAMLTFGRMYADNEMLTLQMCGYNNKKVLRLMFGVASTVGLMVLTLMLWVNPAISAKRQQIMESDEAMVHLIQTLLPGRFQATPDGRHVMFVEALTRDHQRAQNVFVAEQEKAATPDQPIVWSVVSASQGYQSTDKKSGDPFFVMTDGYRYEGVPGNNDYRIIQFRKYAVRLLQNDKRLNIENETLPTWQLWQEYRNPKRAAEFQWRFSVAISAVLLGLLAVPFSRLQPRRSRYLILLPAILIYIIYVNLLVVARHWLEQGALPIFIGMWWVHGVLLCLLLLSLYRQSKQWIGGKR